MMTVFAPANTIIIFVAFCVCLTLIIVEVWEVDDLEKKLEKWRAEMTSDEAVDHVLLAVPVRLPVAPPNPVPSLPLRGKVAKSQLAINKTLTINRAHLTSMGLTPLNRSSFVNSDKVVQTLNSWPPEWQRPLIFTAVADSNFIKSALTFVESLTSLGFIKKEIFLVCMDHGCVKDLKKHGIHAHIEKHANCTTSIGGHETCQIQDIKLMTTLRLLLSNFTVFYFDLDVYLAKSPLEVIPDAKMEIMFQDNDDAKYDYVSSINMGLYMARPTDGTIFIFWQLLEALRKDPAIQTQRIGNDLVTELDGLVSVTLLDLSEFVVFNPNWWKRVNEKSRIKLVHMTCIEGVENKLVLAKQFFGPFHTPSYYHNQKTVTIKFQASYGKTELTNLIAIAAHVASQSGRWVRITGWDWANVMSLVDADALQGDGISMVEEAYWSAAQRFNADLKVVTGKLALGSSKDVDQLTTKVSAEASVDDLQIEVNDPKLLAATLSVVTTQSEKYLCPLYRGSYACFKTCTGKHVH